MVSFDGLFNQYYQPIFYNEIANSTEEQRTIAWNKYAHAFFPAIVLVMLYICRKWIFDRKNIYRREISSGGQYYLMGRFVRRIADDGFYNHNGCSCSV